MGEGGKRGKESRAQALRHTSVDVGLFGELVIRVTVCIYGLVHLFKGHECVDQLVVGVEKTPQPLLMLDMMNLRS